MDNIQVFFQPDMTTHGAWGGGGNSIRRWKIVCWKKKLFSTIKFKQTIERVDKIKTRQGTRRRWNWCVWDGLFDYLQWTCCCVWWHHMRASNNIDMFQDWPSQTPERELNMENKFQAISLLWRLRIHLETHAYRIGELVLLLWFFFCWKFHLRGPLSLLAIDRFHSKKSEIRSNLSQQHTREKRGKLTTTRKPSWRCPQCVCVNGKRCISQRVDVYPNNSSSFILQILFISAKLVWAEGSSLSIW